MTLPTCFRNLENVKSLPGGGWTAGCPVCLAEGHDSTRSHLRIWPSLAFACAKLTGDPDHNRLIRRHIRTDSGESSETELVIIDPEPTVETDKVWSEAELAKLLPDHSYWMGRGISEAVLIKVQSGLARAEERSKLSGRVVMPIRNAKNQIVGWAGRIVADSTFAPRWKILGKKASFVFPGPAISVPAIKATSEVVVVEGVGCSLALSSAGIDQNLVLFGINLSSRLLSLIIALNPKRIIVATNNEESGIGATAAAKIRKRLLAFFNEERVEVRLPWAKDFAEMNGEEIRAWHRGGGKPV